VLTVIPLQLLVADLGAELRRRQDVVVVQERDEIAARDGESGVSRSGQPLVRLADVAHGERLRDLAGSVLRAVVHEDDLERLEVLREDALERLLQEPLAVVGGDDDGDARIGQAVHSIERRPEIAPGIALGSLPSSRL